MASLSTLGRLKTLSSVAFPGLQAVAVIVKENWQRKEDDRGTATDEVQDRARNSLERSLISNRAKMKLIQTFVAMRPTYCLKFSISGFDDEAEAGSSRSTSTVLVMIS